VYDIVLANIYITCQLFSTVPIHTGVVRLFINIRIFYIFFNVFGRLSPSFPVLNVCDYVICCIVSFVKNLYIVVFWLFHSCNMISHIIEPKNPICQETSYPEGGYLYIFSLSPRKYCIRIYKIQLPAPILLCLFPYNLNKFTDNKLADSMSVCVIIDLGDYQFT
jgi:hypothetical protein